MTPCPHCDKPTADTDQTCPHCGKGLSGAALLKEDHSKGLPASAVLCLVVSVLALCGGIVSLSNATAGVGGIAVACLFAIFARIAQAAAYHRRR